LPNRGVWVMPKGYLRNKQAAQLAQQACPRHWPLTGGTCQGCLQSTTKPRASTAACTLRRQGWITALQPPQVTNQVPGAQQEGPGAQLPSTAHLQGPPSPSCAVSPVPSHHHLPALQTPLLLARVGSSAPRRARTVQKAAACCTPEHCSVNRAQGHRCLEYPCHNRPNSPPRVEGWVWWGRAPTRHEECCRQQRPSGRSASHSCHW
jgi:hypothetical protein